VRGSRGCSGVVVLALGAELHTDHVHQQSSSVLRRRQPSSLLVCVQGAGRRGAGHDASEPFRFGVFGHLGACLGRARCRESEVIACVVPPSSARDRPVDGSSKASVASVADCDAKDVRVFVVREEFGFLRLQD
jgi:hypothetical protein